MAFSIRRMRDEDVQGVSVIARRAVRIVNAKFYAPRIVQNHLQQLTPTVIREKAKKRTYVIAVRKSRILGVASIEHNVAHSVFVDPDEQGKGVGQSLMARVESIARKQGHRTVKLSASVNAVGFYMHLGYRKAYEIHNPDYGKMVRMWRRL